MTAIISISACLCIGLVGLRSKHGPVWHAIDKLQRARAFGMWATRELPAGVRSVWPRYRECLDAVRRGA